MNILDIASAIIMPEATGTAQPVDSITEAAALASTMLGATEVSETIELMGYGTFDELKNSGLRARLFGEMVKKALPVVKEYHSDLYLDALMIRDIDGPTRFPFIVRHHGTHTGQMALGMADIERGKDSTILYDVNLHESNRRWFVTFTVIDKSKALSMMENYADMIGDMDGGQ